MDLRWFWYVPKVYFLPIFFREDHFLSWTFYLSSTLLWIFHKRRHMVQVQGLMIDDVSRFGTRSIEWVVIDFVPSWNPHHHCGFSMLSASFTSPWMLDQSFLVMTLSVSGPFQTYQPWSLSTWFVSATRNFIVLLAPFHYRSIWAFQDSHMSTCTSRMLS